MKIRPLDNLKLLGTDCVLDKDKTYDAHWAINQPDWQRDRKLFVNEPEPYGLLLKAGEYVIVDPDWPVDVRGLGGLLREWLGSVDIPRDSLDNESGFITLTDDRMLQVLEQTRKHIHNLQSQ